MKIDNPLTEEQLVAIINICVQCGVEYVGIQRIPQSLKEKGIQETVLFNDKDGSTRGIDADVFSDKSVMARVKEVEEEMLVNTSPKNGKTLGK